MAIFYSRQRLVNRVDVAGLPAGEYYAPTICAYRDLIVERLMARHAPTPGQNWPLPEIDMSQATMTLRATHRNFRIVLSWGSNGWQLRTHGRLADPKGPQACALRWVVGETTPYDRSRLESSLDFFTRVTAILVLVGVEDSLLIELCKVRSAERQAETFHSAWGLMLREHSVDRLFRRAISSRNPALVA